MKKSALHLMPALATLSLENEAATNDMDDALPGITPDNIDNFVLAALDSVKSAFNAAAFPIYLKQDNAHLSQITQAPSGINYIFQTGIYNADVNTDSYPFSTNLKDCVCYSELHSTFASGATILSYNDLRYATHTHRYNNLVFLCTDYLVKKSPVFNANICCKSWLHLNMEYDVCSESLNLTDTMLFLNGDVYIYTDRIVTLNDNSTINIYLTMESSLFGVLKLAATDILFENHDGEYLPVSGVVLLTGENASFFIIRFKGNSNFIVTFKNTGKTVNWTDIA
ncbi:MAG: hypothetical protein HYZ31_12015 [Gammaproteobacteria bacterium]|nr:hypothetical protein [Gammaproteobacteria bacterium]